MAINKSKLTERIVEELDEEIGLPTIIVTPADFGTDYEWTLMDSKFGGVPYWDKSLPYPTDKAGNKLKLLAQFNLEEVAEACGSEVGQLPKSGILQFFILAGDGKCGMDFDDFTNNDGFRVIYHPTVDPSVTEKDVLRLGIPTTLPSEGDSGEFDPVTGQVLVSFELQKKADSMAPGYKEHFLKKAAYYGWNIEDNPDESLETLLYDIDDQAADVVSGNAHVLDSCLLGYPCFTQDDPRTEEERYERYDTQLFQMASYDEEDTQEYGFTSLWGDDGIAHFFINREKLRARDFSDILYYWDCY